MAIRLIRKNGDAVLGKKCRYVDKIDNRILTLLEDMAATLHNANGVGLAAPQIGVLRQIAVIDVGDGIVELINPEIIKSEGELIDVEGCLSIPGVYGEVARPRLVTVRAHDRNGKTFELEGEGLLARAICHETEHLQGKLFLDRVIRYIEPESDQE